MMLLPFLFLQHTPQHFPCGRNGEGFHKLHHLWHLVSSHMLTAPCLNSFLCYLSTAARVQDNARFHTFSTAFVRGGNNTGLLHIWVAMHQPFHLCWPHLKTRCIHHAL